MDYLATNAVRFILERYIVFFLDRGAAAALEFLIVTSRAATGIIATTQETYRISSQLK